MFESLQSASKFRRSADTLSCCVAGEITLLHTKTNMYHSLAGTASFLWEALAVARSCSELAELLIEQYDVSSEVATSDLSKFLNELIEAQLLVSC